MNALKVAGIAPIAAGILGPMYGSFSDCCNRVCGFSIGMAIPAKLRR